MWLLQKGRIVGLQSADEGGLSCRERVAVANHLNHECYERGEDGDDVHWSRTLVSLRYSAYGSKYRTDHVVINEEIISRLRRVKMKKKIGCKEKISVRMKTSSL